MRETKYERVEFADLVRDIKKDEIVLPDFQRGFVWRDKEKQKALIASVLTKLPIGTILLLEIEKDKYACKKIGLKNKKPDISSETKVVRALLDGQQRVTVLTAFFSNELFHIAKGEEFVSPSLKRRYFLQIPKFKFLSEKREWFGARKLIVPEEIHNGEYPVYSTDEIAADIIYFESKNYKNILGEDIDSVSVNDLIHFCTNNSENEECYLIPLYYLYGSAAKNNNQRKLLRGVIERIAELYAAEILEELERTTDIDNELITNSFENTKDGKATAERIREDIQSEKFEIRDEESELHQEITDILSQRKEQWAEDVREFLESCVEKLELYKIEMAQADILRAIDIYQNLNLGGKSLDVFDLILARAATQSNSENLLQVVSGYILENHKEDYEIFKSNCENQIINAYEEFVSLRDEYSASYKLGAWNDTENELAPGFCNALMSTVGTLNFFLDENMNVTLNNQKHIVAFNSRVTKSEYLLRIDAKRIDRLIRDACRGMDRACFFLQMRCGIRNISEVQYKLIFVTLSVILSVDKWFHSKKVCNYLETWYWAAIFSGEFKREQNAAFQTNLKELLQIITALELEEETGEKAEPDYIIQLCSGVFCDGKFANEDILLINNEFVEPEEVLTKTICQYYLAMTYPDILKADIDVENYERKQLSVFTEFPDGGLQKHHIMPIGELNKKYKDVDKERGKGGRSDRTNVYNSPLNFAYISPKANRAILNAALSYYAKVSDNETLVTLGIHVQDDNKISKDDTELRNFLHERYNDLCASLKKKFTGYLGANNAAKIEDFHQKSKSKNY